MLTEVKKTIHIVVRDIHAVPDEQVLAASVMLDKKVNSGSLWVHQERGDALIAAADLGSPEQSYRVWTVHMHFIRDCAFEPKQLKSEDHPNE